ncbi:MAG: hypothetical protein GFH27_549285n243 [Chloroflexi bacterium AL-W]|nr:hypothetical protein [Chloroflexi bacterium AL-N1]NOK65755.1 hypothetical protein [Chloroflexi bacterium AL-N10]NOK74304.1 hypothetical protein [Chloroflexi bacterium AL-N5]NOK80788.1 hypothetical protein [Chloroflexi bacterium AL-W]NOK88562.1 hypothetical protein [Chloroflexi bacterium AL-N15]
MDQISSETILLLIIVLLVMILTLLHHARAMAGKLPTYRRPLPALEIVRRALERGAETGRAIHLSPGSGSIGSRSTTVETVAGLLAAERVSTEASLNGAPILASSGDAVAHLALRGFLRQAYQRAGFGQDYDPANVQLIAHQDPLAYASGIAALYGRQRLEASQLIGSFGQEFLLVGEIGAQQGVPQVAGATTSQSLPLVYLSADGVLIGEEIFAAEAYLSRSPAPQARLMTQDILRTVVIVILIILLLIAIAGIPIPL